MPNSSAIYQVSVRSLLWHCALEEINLTGSTEQLVAVVLTAGNIHEVILAESRIAPVLSLLVKVSV